MTDEFEHHTPSLTSPVSAAIAISPSDTEDLSHVTRALFVGVGGELVVTMLSGDTATLSNVQPGVMYPLRVTRVHATGTTAAAVLGLY